MLDLGRPIAWKSRPPFGIVLKCSQENFVSLCLAFSDDVLSMDEDLVVQKVLSKYFYLQESLIHKCLANMNGTALYQRITGRK